MIKYINKYIIEDHNYEKIIKKRTKFAFYKIIE